MTEEIIIENAFHLCQRLEQENEELIEDNLNLSKENEELCEDNTRLGNNLDYINEELDKYKSALEEIREDIRSFYGCEDSSNDYKLVNMIDKINEVLG